MFELAAWTVIDSTNFDEKPTKAEIPQKWKTLESNFPMSFVEMQCLGVVHYSYLTEFEIESDRYIKIDFPNSIDCLGMYICFTQLYQNELSVLTACSWCHRVGGGVSSAGCIERNNSETKPIQSAKIENGTIIIDAYSNSNLSSYFNVNNTLDMDLQLLGY